MEIACTLNFQTNCFKINITLKELPATHSSFTPSKNNKETPLDIFKKICPLISSWDLNILQNWRVFRFRYWICTIWSIQSEQGGWAEDYKISLTFRTNQNFVFKLGLAYCWYTISHVIHISLKIYLTLALIANIQEKISSFTKFTRSIPMPKFRLKNLECARWRKWNFWCTMKQILYDTQTRESDTKFNKHNIKTTSSILLATCLSSETEIQPCPLYIHSLQPKRF